MKVLKHERDKTGDYGRRVLLHVPMGFIIIGSAIVHPLLPIPLAWLFIKYEDNEDLHTSDQAWKDYAGAIAGAVMALIALGFLKFWR